VTRLETGRAESEAFDFAGEFGGGGEGKRRFVLVLTGNDERIEKVQCRGSYAHHRLARRRDRIGNISYGEGLGRAVLVAEQRLHALTVPGGWDYHAFTLPIFARNGLISSDSCRPLPITDKARVARCSGPYFVMRLLCWPQRWPAALMRRLPRRRKPPIPQTRRFCLVSSATGAPTRRPRAARRFASRCRS